VAPVPGCRYVSASVLLYLLVRRGMFDPGDLLKRPPHNELLSLLAVRCPMAPAPLAICTCCSIARHVVMNVPWASLS
jgi:hypothetical protein